MHMHPLYEYVNYASAVLLSIRELFETGSMHMHPLYEYVNDASAVLNCVRPAVVQPPRLILAQYVQLHACPHAYVNTL